MTIYLDNHMLTQPSPRVIERVVDFLKRDWHFPEAPYLKDEEPFEAMAQGEKSIRALLGVTEGDELVMIGSAREGLWKVIDAFCLHTCLQGERGVIWTTPTSPPSLLLGMQKWLPMGCSIRYLPLDEHGQITPDALRSSLSSSPSLISLPGANGLTGVVHLTEEWAEVAADHRVLFHVDASDLIGKIDVRFASLCPDVLTFDGAQIHGLQGSGAALVRVPFKMQEVLSSFCEKGHLTLHLSEWIGLSTACEEAEEHIDHLCMETARLRNQLEERLVDQLVDVYPLFSEVERVPHITCISFSGVEAELLAFMLRKRGVVVSIGGGKEQELETMLTAIGMAPQIAKCAISLGLSRLTTEEEIERGVEIIAESVEQCRHFSKEFVP